MSFNLTVMINEWPAGGMIMPWFNNDKFMVICQPYTRELYNLGEGVVGLDSIENRLSALPKYYRRYYFINGEYKPDYPSHIKRNIHLNIFV